MLVHNDIQNVSTGNCLVFDEECSPSLTVPSYVKKSRKKTTCAIFISEMNGTTTEESKEGVYIDLDYPDMDYPNLNVDNHVSGIVFVLSNVVTYVAGYVCSFLCRKIKCEMCLYALRCDTGVRAPVSSYAFIRYSSRGKLWEPNEDTNKICMYTEKYLRYTLNACNNNLSSINVNSITHNIFMTLEGGTYFRCLDHHIIQLEPTNNHALLLMKCLISRYLESRLNHLGKLKTSNIVSSKFGIFIYFFRLLFP